MIGTVVKAGRYKVTIKRQFGRWLVGHNGTVGWCVVDRDTNEIAAVHSDRKMAERSANNRLIKDQDAARADQPASATFVVQARDPRDYQWNTILTTVDRSRAVDVAAQFMGEGYDSRIDGGTR